MKTKILVVFGAIGAFVLSAVSCLAEVPSATSTMDTIMGTVISTSVGLATTIFQTYWPYVLVIGAIVGLVYLFKRLVHVSSR